MATAVSRDKPVQMTTDDANMLVVVQILHDMLVLLAPMSIS